MKRLVFACVAAFGLCTAWAEPIDDHWKQWRGPYNTGMAATDAPLQWSATENIRWKAQIPGRGFSTPVVWEDKIFVTTAVPATSAVAAGAPAGRGRRGAAGRGAGRGRGGRGGREAAPALVEHRFLVMAFDRESGKKLWERNPITATPHEGYHRRYGSFASNSPVTDGKRLYAFFGSRGLYAYDFAGKLLWKKDFGVKMRMRNAFGEGVAPVVHDGKIILVFDQEADSFVLTVDASSGEELWRRSREGEVSGWAQPLVTEYDGRWQVIVSAHTAVRSYDLGSGDEIWSCSGIGMNTIPAVVRAGDVVYAMSGWREPNLLAIRLGGEGDITGSDSVLWSNERGNSYTASPVIHDGIYYMLTDRGLLSALDAMTGEPHYAQQRLPQTYSFKASPVGANGKLYLAAENGDVIVVKMGPEFEVLTTNSMPDESFISSPVVVDGNIYLRGQNTLYAIGE